MNNIDIVSLEDIHRIVSPYIEDYLFPLGFEFQKPCHWVRSTDSPIKQMFILQQYKGGTISPLWGLSLDFVPHISGSSIKWHRTVKSARLDAVMDPRDRSMTFHYMYGAKHIEQTAFDVINKAFEKAEAFWQIAKSIDALPALYESIKLHMSGSGLGFYNYTQHPLAYAFVLAKVGRYQDAKIELEIFLQGHTKPAISKQINELLNQSAIT